MEEGLCDTFAGALGGLACVLAGQPLDTVKVKQQTYPQVYRTMSQTLSKTFWQEGGLLGFYAGCGSAVFSNVAENAVLFFSFERCQQLVRWTLDLRSADDMNALHQAYAGALASVVSSVVINPLERIKCKQQVHHQQSQYFHQNSRLVAS